MLGVILSCPPAPGVSGPQTRLDLAYYSESAGIPSLVQFAGGGFPAAMSISGVGCQLDVVERKPDGSPRTFRACAPILWPSSNPGSPGSGTEIIAEEAAAAPSALAGVYPAGADPSGLAFTMSNARGTYIASIATAINSFVVAGVGNPLGNSGPDYQRMVRYFCPFRAQNAADHGTVHEFCGAMIVYVTLRVDLDGYVVEAMFANSHLDVPHTSYSGDTNKNPGWIIYNSINLNKGLGSGYTTYHLDNYNQQNTGNGFAPNGTGSINGYLVSPFTGSKQHQSAPGTMPGWKFAVYRNNLAFGRILSMLEGAGNALAFEGRGFSARSQYGFGVNEIRHSDPRDWVANVNFTQERAAANSILNSIRGQIFTGRSSTPAGENMNGDRDGIWHCQGPLDPNEAGGQLIAGHGLRHMSGEYLKWLTLATMMCSRRVNHAFFAWGTERPLVAGDCLATEFDPSPDVNANVTVSLLHHDDTDSGAPRRLPSTQFAVLGPQGDDYGGRSNTQTRRGPTTRTWNTLQSGQTIGADGENPVRTSGYSHNVGHSARFQICREAWLFGLSGIGREICITYAAFSSSYFNAWETGFAEQNWNFGRPTRNLHAWGFRDLTIPAAGSGDAIYRRRNTTSNPLARSLGDRNIGTGNPNFGRVSADWISARVQAWGLWWQLQGAALASDDYRTMTINQPEPHNPAALIADWIGHVSSEIGLVSSTEKVTDPINPIAWGPCDYPARTGALPSDRWEETINNDDDQRWTWVLDFHEVYFSLMVDATMRHVSPARQAGLRRSLMRTYWLHRQGALVCDQFNLNQLGVPKWVPVSAGTTGTGRAEVNEDPNPPVTAALLDEGALYWTYRYPLADPLTANYPTHDLGIGHDQENWLLGFLLCFRYGTAQEKQQCLSYLARRYDLPPSSTAAQILATIRSDARSLSSVNSRRMPLDGELELLV